MTQSSDAIVDYFRLDRYGKTDNPRPILVKLNRIINAYNVFHNSRNLKGRVRIRTDLSMERKAEQFKLLIKWSKLLERNKLCSQVTGSKFVRHEAVTTDINFVNWFLQVVK